MRRRPSKSEMSKHGLFQTETADFLRNIIALSLTPAGAVRAAQNEFRNVVGGGYV
jgi:hypothetical protein